MTYMTYKTYMTRTIQGAALVLCAMALSGCAAIYSPRSIDSYNSTFHKGPDAPGDADPYTFGGLADASGGLWTRTSYSTDTHSWDPRSATPSGEKAMVDSRRINVPTEPGMPPPNSMGGSSSAPPVIHRTTIEPQKGTPMNNQPAHG